MLMRGSVSIERRSLQISIIPDKTNKPIFLKYGNITSVGQSTDLPCVQFCLFFICLAIGSPRP